MLPEILAERGWNTYLVGKWHLCPTDEMHLAATRRNWPSGRGTERFYGFLGAETNQWYPDLVYDNHPVDPPRSPDEGYHLTDDITDKALEFIKDAKAVAPEKPFFLYYAIDIVPTVLDLLGVDPPEILNGHTQSYFDGVSMRGSIDDGSAPSTRKTQFYAMLGSRAIWHEGWKAVTTHPCIAGWGHFNDDTWELYHTDFDRAELHDLAAENPEKLRELVALWFAEAGANGAFPLDDRSAVEILSTARPQLTAPRSRYTYFPGTAPVPEWQAVSTRNRSFVIGAVVDITAPPAEGVLFAMGSRFGGHALYVKNGRLHYVNNFLGIEEQQVAAREDIPAGDDLILTASFEKEEQRPDCAIGTLTLYRGDREIGQGRIKTQLGAFAIAGSGLNVGRDPGEPITADYSGEPPYAFTGGTINRIVIDVSGDPYLDLEREAALMLMRE
jgi:arylsulfatase